MPVHCVTFEDEAARDLAPPPNPAHNIQGVDIEDYLNVRGRPARLRIRDVSGDGRNELVMAAGTVKLTPQRITGIYQVVVHAAHHGRGRGVYTVEAFDSNHDKVDSADNVIAQPRIRETLILITSSREPIDYITITGQEIAVEKICFFFE